MLSFSGQIPHNFRMADHQGVYEIRSTERCSWRKLRVAADFFTPLANREVLLSSNSVTERRLRE
jgi:hypothetical protein